MTGLEVIKQAMLLLNYTDDSGRVDSRVAGAAGARGLAVLNQVLADVWFAEKRGPFVPLTDVAASLPVSDRTCSDVLPYGVAMLLAQGEGDGDNQSTFAAIYNQKRSALTYVERRCNALP